MRKDYSHERDTLIKHENEPSQGLLAKVRGQTFFIFRKHIAFNSLSKYFNCIKNLINDYLSLSVT